jgi:phosphoribosylformylglycinamidine synthase
MLGADIDLTAWNALPPRGVLFGEAQGRIVVSTSDPARAIAIAGQHGVPARAIGRVTREQRLRIVAGDRTIDSPLSRLASLYYHTIAAIMQQGPADTAVAEQHPSIATV